MTAQDQSTLDERLSLSPQLKTLRDFVDDLHKLFALRCSPEQAWKIWWPMRRHSKYLANAHFRKALDVLQKEKMLKLSKEDQMAIAKLLAASIEGNWVSPPGEEPHS